MHHVLKIERSTCFQSLLAFFFVLVAASCTKVELSSPSAEQDRLRNQNVFTAASTISPAKQTARAGVRVSPKIFGFYEYLPKGYANTDTMHYPLLICMHGVGQIGNGTTDLPGLLTYGPAMMINNGTFPTTFTVDGKSYRFIIITPQLNDFGMFPDDINQLIEYCKTNYRVDQNKVYIAGVSLGGAVAWHYAGAKPEYAAKVAAIVPIAAWTTPENGFQLTQQEAQNIASANVKIWQTHCYSDPTAMFSWSVSQGNMVRNSSPAPDTDPKLTCFNSSSHDAWTTTYDPTYKEGGMNIYQWMLHYSKGTKASALPLKVPFNQVVTIKASNNLYLHNEAGGSTPITINANTFGVCEGFVVTQSQGSRVFLQNQGYYLSKVDASSVGCTVSTPGSSESFLWIFNGDGTVSFKGNNSKYLSNKNGSLNCLATSIGVNEKFRINQ